MDKDTDEPRVRGPFRVYTGLKGVTPVRAVPCDRRRASSAVNELFWSMNQCVGPDGLKPEAFRNLALSMDVSGAEIWIARALPELPLAPVVTFRPLVTNEWVCAYGLWSATHADIHTLVALAHRHITSQGFELPAIDSLKKLTSRLALA